MKTFHVTLTYEVIAESKEAALGHLAVYTADPFRQSVQDLKQRLGQQPDIKLVDADVAWHTDEVAA